MTLGLLESPRYLYRKDKGEEALQMLCGVYGKIPDNEIILKEQNNILEALQID